MAEARQSDFVLRWPVHETYRIVGGKLYADGGTSRFGKPLEDDDFFTSFARLAAHGDPSDTSIKRWVRRYGLLTRDETMSVQSFRDEVNQARHLLALYGAVKGRDAEAIRGLLSDKRLEGEHDETVIEVGLYVFEGTLEEEKLDGVRPGFVKYVPKTRWSGKLLSDVPELAKRAGVEGPSKIKVMDTDPHPATAKPYTPSPSWPCDDLLSALYLQLCLLATGHALLQECAGCGQAFFLTRPNKRHCNDACRQRARHKRKNKAAPATT